MVKIITLFERNYETDKQVRDEITPGAEWVAAGEGTATRKLDGTCCLIKDGELYKRYEVKNGKATPEGFVPAQEPDPVTGDCPGWLRVKNDDPNDRWHLEAIGNCELWPLSDGTYELVGPKIQGNRESMSRHTLVQHGVIELPDAPRTFEALKEFLSEGDIEGIVWHHEDGRMVKIKARDFGLKRQPAKVQTA